MQHAISSAKGPIHAKVTLPGAKNITYRALLLAALADGVSDISGISTHPDIHTFITALNQLGIVTQFDEKTKSCIIAGGNGHFPKKQATVWCQDSKTIVQFLLAACAATPGVFYVDGSPELRKQSITHFVEQLTRQGAQFIPNDASNLPFTLIGSDTLLGGNISTNSPNNNQLISALLMIAPLARSPFNFNVTDLANRPEIDMTIAMMAEYGVLVHRIHQEQMMVPVPQRYQAKDYTVEPDLALATYFLGAAAITAGEITLLNTKRTQSKQTDTKFLTVLESMGCSINETSTGITLKGPSTLPGIEVSMRHFSNAFLTLVAMAPFANSPTRIAHLGTINAKEAKRITTIKTEFLKMDIRVETGDNWIKIYPGKPKPTQLDCHDDPRIAMALALIGLKVPGITITNTDSIATVFPDFFTQWNKLVETASVNA